MNNELRQHKTSDKIKWWLTLIAFILIGVTITGMLLGYIKPMTREEEDIKQEQEIDLSNAEFKTEFVNAEGIKLFSATPMTYSQRTNTATKTIYAEVLPSTAVNKNVTWSVKWESENSENVSNYVTVSPNSENQTYADVTCYAPFNGNIVVTVTTQDGGYSADCLVTFVGVPTEIIIDTNVSNNGTNYNLGLGGTYTLNVQPNNPFYQVGNDYKNLEVSLFANGTLTIGTYNFNYGTGVGEGTWEWENVKTVSLDTILDKFIIMSYENGVITLSTGSKELNGEYYESYYSTDGGRTKYYTNKVKEINTECSFGISIREPVSGVVRVINLNLDKTIVASVDITENLLF